MSYTIKKEVSMQVTIKPNYIAFSIITLIISLVSKFYASSGMKWYYTLRIPSYTPPEWIFSTVWTLIYTLSTIAIIIVWNNFKRDKQFYIILLLFALNAFFNIIWTYLFFYQQNILWACMDAFALFITLLALVVTIGQRSLIVAALLVPYLAWITFAVWLNFIIWIMN